MAKARPAPVLPGGNAFTSLSPWIAGLLLAAAVVTAYHNSFTVPFVFDDEPSIVSNATIRHLAQSWWPPADGGLTVSGRPLLNFTLGLNYAISGTQVWSYHALNLLIHLAAGGLLFGVVRRTLLQPLLAPTFGTQAWALALVTALLWTLHPLQTEAVTYIVQRAESLMGLLYLLTLWCFIRAVEPGAAPKWLRWSFVACLLGMATKEVMVSAPLIVACYDRTFVAGSWREVWRRRRNFYLALMGTWLLLLALVLSTSGRGGTAGLGTAVSPFAYALTQFEAIALYLRLAAWPSPLVLDYGRTLASGSEAVLLPALVVMPLALASLWAGWRGRPIGFCGIFFFAVLAPSSSVVPIATQTIAEHRMYLPLAAVLAVVVTSLYLILGRKALAILGVTALALGAATVARNQDYRSAISIYEDTVAKRPGNARAMALLADYYQREGRFEDARGQLERSLQVEPGVPEVLNNLGNVWQKLGEPAKAVDCFQQAVAIRPRDDALLNNLGNALILAGCGPEGLAQLEAALRISPNAAGTHANLANALAQAGRLPESVAHFEASLKLAPNDVEMRNSFGNALLALGRNAEAVAQLEAAVRSQPNNADVHNRLGIVLARTGRLRPALAEFEAALALDPNHVSARQNAALARKRLGGG